MSFVHVHVHYFVVRYKIADVIIIMKLQKL